MSKDPLVMSSNRASKSTRSGLHLIPRSIPGGLGTICIVANPVRFKGAGQGACQQIIPGNQDARA